jgi:cytochrome c556
MQTALHSKESVGAVAGPRGYLDAQGNVMAYGRMKNMIEKALRSAGAKLVSGNSFYDAESFRKAVTQRIGSMMTDGDLQTEIINAGQEVVLAPDAHAASDGEKFVEKPALALVLQKARTMLRPSVDDHLRFAMQELPSYFPDFRARIEQIRAKYNITDDFIAHASEQEKSELLELLEQRIAEFNAQNQQVMLEDIARLAAARPVIET